MRGHRSEAGAGSKSTLHAVMVGASCRNFEKQRMMGLNLPTWLTLFRLAMVPFVITVLFIPGVARYRHNWPGNYRIRPARMDGRTRQTGQRSRWRGRQIQNHHTNAGHVHHTFRSYGADLAIRFWRHPAVAGRSTYAMVHGPVFARSVATITRALSPIKPEIKGDALTDSPACIECAPATRE